MRPGCSLTSNEPRADGRSNAPPKARRMDRSVPEADERVVEPEQGDRTPGHVEGGDVAADEVASDGDAAALEDSVHGVVDDVQLDQRSAAQTVHEGERSIARFE